MLLTARNKEWKAITTMQLLWIIESQKLKPVEYPNGKAYVDSNNRTIVQTVDDKHYVRK